MTTSTQTNYPQPISGSISPQTLTFLLTTLQTERDRIELSIREVIALQRSMPFATTTGATANPVRTSARSRSRSRRGPMTNTQVSPPLAATPKPPKPAALTAKGRRRISAAQRARHAAARATAALKTQAAGA